MAQSICPFEVRKVDIVLRLKLDIVASENILAGQRNIKAGRQVWRWTCW